MNKSTLSVVSLTTGIISTTLSAIVFPLALVMRSPSGIALVGALGLFTLLMGIIGIVTASIKLITTNNITVEDQDNRAIAKKGFWFSSIPTAFWVFVLILGSIH